VAASESQPAKARSAYPIGKPARHVPDSRSNGGCGLISPSHGGATVGN
jgi:hypothetical protein